MTVLKFVKQATNSLREKEVSWSIHNSVLFSRIAEICRSGVVLLPFLFVR